MMMVTTKKGHVVYRYDPSTDSWRRGNLRDHVRYLRKSIRGGSRGMIEKGGRGG